MFDFLFSVIDTISAIGSSASSLAVVVGGSLALGIVALFVQLVRKLKGFAFFGG